MNKRDSIKNAPRNVEKVIIEQPTITSVGLEVTGTADLIQHHFGQKSIEQMLAKHMGISVQRDKKKPSELIEAATIYNADGKVCMSPVCFKKAMLCASTQLKGLKKTQLRPALFVQGGSVPIKYSRMEPRMDVTRLPNRQPDVRFRPAFKDWSARLIIQFNSQVLSVQTVVDLLNRAGSSGIGEWRPERDGVYGTFRVTRHIADPDEFAEVGELCAVAMQPIVIPQWAIDAEIDPETLSKVFSQASEEAKTARTARTSKKSNGRVEASE